MGLSEIFKDLSVASSIFLSGSPVALRRMCDMKLYSRAASPYAARVRIAIYAKSLPIEIVNVAMGWGKSPDFLKLNPLGRVPVLAFDDGTTLPESGVIVEYLEDAYPDPPLRPRDPRDLAKVRFVTQVAEHYVMPLVFPLFGLFAAAANARDEAAIEAQTGKLQHSLGHLEPLLSRGRYVFGDRLSTADVWLAPLTFALHGLMDFSGRKDLLDRYPSMLGYREVVDGDPHLSRVWAEMEEGVRQFLASRPSAGGTG
jgi:glutathione S-transferase